jgi:hypothetical protein
LTGKKLFYVDPLPDLLLFRQHGRVLWVMAGVFGFDKYVAGF